MTHRRSRCRFARSPTRQRPAFQDVGLHEHPGPVADHGDRLAGSEERTGEAHGGIVHADPIRVGHPPGKTMAAWSSTSASGAATVASNVRSGRGGRTSAPRRLRGPPTPARRRPLRPLRPLSTAPSARRVPRLLVELRPGCTPRVSLMVRKAIRRFDSSSAMSVSVLHESVRTGGFRPVLSGALGLHARCGPSGCRQKLKCRSQLSMLLRSPPASSRRASKRPPSIRHS
ncbi:hypothetical protein BH24ACT5_BH24ACT5_10570 [soil metagenome]